MGYVVRTKHDGFVAGGLRRLPKGGGKGGGGAPDYAKQMAKKQQHAQAIVDAQFNPRIYGKTAASGEYDPNVTYYNADGSVWTPKQQTSKAWAIAGDIANSAAPRAFGNPANARTKSARSAAEQYAKLRDSGALFTEIGQSGGFGDDFYSGRRQAYLDYYIPQYERQQKAAREAIESSIASRGLSASSIGAKEMGDFSSQASDAWTSILRGSDDYVNSIKANIAAQKAALVSGGINAADSTLQQQAAEAASLSAATPNFSPLGQLFSNLSTPAAMAATSAYNGMMPGQTTGVQAATPYGKPLYNV